MYKSCSLKYLQKIAEFLTITSNKISINHKSYKNQILIINPAIN